MMNRKNPRTLLRVLLITLATVPFLILSLTSSAVRGPNRPASVDKTNSKAVTVEPNARLARIAPIAFLPAGGTKASGNLDQVRNGGVGCDTTVPNSCIDPPDWVNGNAGASNAHYREGESIPYRLRLDNLSVGQHTVVIEWDTRHSGVNAIDYITYYDRIAETVQPLLGLTGSYGSPSAVPLPTPGLTNGATVATTSFGNLPAGERNLTVYNANNLSFSFVYHEDPLSAAQTATQLQITFNATASNVLFAWGGHIASRGDWGAGNSASGISGSPYHTRLISLDGSGGNQDRSLSAAAVAPPAGCTLSGNTDICDSPTVTHYTLPGTVDPSLAYVWTISNSGGSAAFISDRNENPANGEIFAEVTTAGTGQYIITLTKSNGGGSATCSLTVNVHQKPAADAGAASYEHCSTDGFAFAMSAATATVPSDGTLTWSVSPSAGVTISDIHALNPTITLPGVGSVTATLTVTGAASCGNASDSSTLTVSSTASANAGPDQASCASNPAVTLAGSFSGAATSASWSGGGGSFNPNNTTLNAVYTPSATEVSNGSATLTLTTNDPAGSCGAAQDTITITINPNPTVEISLVNACAGSANLHATASGGTGPYTYSWKKNNVAVVQANSADLPLTGPGSYTVSVTDSSSTTCGSDTDTFVVCYTEGAAASAPIQGSPDSLNAAIKQKSTPTFLSRLTTLVVSTFALVIL
jgi:hypothetical protein